MKIEMKIAFNHNSDWVEYDEYWTLSTFIYNKILVETEEEADYIQGLCLLHGIDVDISTPPHKQELMMPGIPVRVVHEN